MTAWRRAVQLYSKTTMAAAGSATGCVNPRSKNRVVPSSVLENVDADKPLPRRYSLGMDEFVDKSAYTSSRRSSSRHRRLTVQLYCPALCTRWNSFDLTTSHSTNASKESVEFGSVVTGLAIITLAPMKLSCMYVLSITLYRLGDLGEMSAKGSVHEYLAHLHDEGRCPVTSFWWGKEHMVSVCSPQAFKDTVRLTYRAGEREGGGVEASRREARVPREGDPVSALPTTPRVTPTSGSSPCCLLDVRLILWGLWEAIFANNSLLSACVMSDTYPYS